MLAKRSLAIYLDLDAPPFPDLDTDPRLLLGLVYRFMEEKIVLPWPKQIIKRPSSISRPVITCKSNWDLRKARLMSACN